MNIAIILASGNGTRMRNSKIPKQFIEIKNKPIVSHTVEKFINNQNIDETIIVCHPEWISFLKQSMEKLHPKNNYHIIEGGTCRNDSIKLGLIYIQKNFDIDNNDIILTHDAVRIFISSKIINDNIEYAKKYGAVDTVVPATDTIVCSLDGKKINNIPNRDQLFNGQTPQTFKWKIINDIYSKKNIDASDACSLAIQNGFDVYLLEGEYSNIKITSDFDLAIIDAMVRTND